MAGSSPTTGAQFPDRTCSGSMLGRRGESWEAHMNSSNLLKMIEATLLLVWWLLIVVMISIDGGFLMMRVLMILFIRDGNVLIRQ